MHRSNLCRMYKFWRTAVSPRSIIYCLPPQSRYLSVLFPWNFKVKLCMYFLFLPCSAHLILLDLTTQTIFFVRSKVVFTRRLVGPNVVSSSLSNTLILCSSLRARDPISHHYTKAAGRICIVSRSISWCLGHVVEGTWWLLSIHYRSTLVQDVQR